MSRILTLVFLVVISPSFAQFRLGKHLSGHKCLIFEPATAIFAQASPQSEVIVVLPVAHEVLIEKVTAYESEKRGFRSSWYEVSGKKDGKEFRGFVWGGSLSVLSLEYSLRQEIFLLGIDNYNQEEGFVAKARLLKNRQLLSEIEMEALSMSENNRYEYSISAEKMGTRGFTDITDIFMLNFSYPACGYPSAKILIFWDGKQLNYAAQAQNLIETGVVSIETEIRFPDQTGNKNKLLLIETTQEFEKDHLIQQVVEQKSLKWNGKKMED